MEESLSRVQWQRGVGSSMKMAIISAEPVYEVPSSVNACGVVSHKCLSYMEFASPKISWLVRSQQMLRKEMMGDPGETSALGRRGCVILARGCVVDKLDLSLDKSNHERCKSGIRYMLASDSQ